MAPKINAKEHMPLGTGYVSTWKYISLEKLQQKN
jgi:hypothetical protein